MELQLISLSSIVKSSWTANSSCCCSNWESARSVFSTRSTIYTAQASESKRREVQEEEDEENGNIELFLFVNWTQLSSHRECVCSWKLAIHKSSPSSQHISKVHKHKFQVSTSHHISFFSFLLSYSQCNFPHNRQSPSVCMLEMFTFPLHPPHSHSKYVNTCPKFPWISKRVVRWFGAHNQA